MSETPEPLQDELEQAEDVNMPDETKEWDGVDESTAEGEEPEQDEDAPDQSVEETDEGQHLETESDEEVTE